MGVCARLISFDRLFSLQTTEPIIVNHFNINTQIDKERLNALIYTHYEGDSLNVVPSCEGGELKGEYNVGIRCEVCGTVVQSVTERPLESVLWIEPPHGVAAFINPEMWTILSSALTHTGVNLLEWICNPTSVLPATIPIAARKLQTLLPERGINYFYANFDKLMQMLFDNGLVKGDYQQRQDLYNLIVKSREAVFAHRLPIPSKLGFITEKTVTSTYADLTMLPAVDAIRTISATVNSPTPLSLKVLQARAVKANMLLAQYHQDFMTHTLSTKGGWYRKHVYGSRLHFTFRAVISSLSDNHAYDELHLPWSMSVMAWKIHLTSKLMSRGFTPNECTKFLHEHALTYHPLLDELFQELINESPHKVSDGRPCLPIILNRNPTLMRGSIQALGVTKIKIDPDINSISMSVLCLVAPNADFDGRKLPSLKLSNCWKLSKAA